MECPLCLSSQTTHFYKESQRQWLYWLCQNCDFVYRDKGGLLLPLDEKARYQTHKNSIESVGYVNFLMPVVKTLRPYLSEGNKGLDFGSGPGPILDILFGREGFQVQNYDPYFAPLDLSDLSPFDFITCTEAFEHFYHPHHEMGVLKGLLKKQGFLLIMTQLRGSLKEFSKWSYRMDNTHVGFLNEKSLMWLAQNWGFELLSSQGGIAVMRQV